MKKSLLALAVLASFASAASAQSSVTMYGLVDAGITAERGSTDGSITKLATGVQQGNRLGFKGVEDLGNGLKANFQLESGFKLDDGTGSQGALFGRQAYVGLSGNFGAINLGRQYNLLFNALDEIDPFNTGLTGAASNLMSPGNNGGNVRTDNSITYSTPNIQGFSGNLMYGAGEQAGSSSTGRTIGASVGYANGPVMLAVAYDKRNETALTNNLKLILVGGTYDFGPVKLHAIYESEKSDINVSNVSDFRDYLIGVSAPIGVGTLMASYIDQNDRTHKAKGAKQMAIGYSHPVSKRTSFYTSYGYINNDDAAFSSVGDASNGGSGDKQTVGGSSSGLTVGMRHKF